MGKTTNNYQKEFESDILFQKLGNTWYIFTEIENEFIYSALPEGLDPRTTKLELYDVIEEHMKKIKTHNKSPNSMAA